MACNNAYTVYWAGTSFTSAAQIYTDGNLTTVAPDGLYSVGGIVREMTGGILGSPQPCPTCVIPCGQPFNFGGGGTGEYTIYFDLGSSPGAAILTFSPGVNNTTLFPIPDGCTWIYDGVTASEYSSLLGGYQTGIIGAPDPGPPSGFGTPCNITPDLGTNGFQATGVSYLWDQASSNFVAGPTILMGSNVPPTGYTGITNNTGAYQTTLLDWNCADQAAGLNVCTGGGLFVPPSPYNSNVPVAPNLAPFTPAGTQWPLAGGAYRGATMVIPSPPSTASTVLKLIIDGPCPGTWWGLDLQCPIQLPSILGSPAEPLGTPLADVCNLVSNIDYYHVPVDAFGNSNPNSKYFAGTQFPGTPAGQPGGVLGLHDWIFTDPNGEFPLANGVYKMSFDAQDGGGFQDWAVEVGVLEYKDIGTYAPQTNVHALPPEVYVADPGATQGVQNSGTRIPGIVKSITLCSGATVGCGTSIAGSGGTGQYNLQFDATAATGAIVIKFNPYAVPDRCVWTYDGITASEYSSASEGYLQGVVGQRTSSLNGGQYSCGTFMLSNDFGSSGGTNSGNIYDYNGSTFVNSGLPATMGPYTNNASGGTSLTPAAPGVCTMVIPKPNATPNLVDLLIDGPCGGTAWEVDIFCPVDCNRFDAGVKSGACGVYSTSLYTISVHTNNGVSAQIQLHDWVFTDINGVNQCGTGTFPVTFGGNNYLMTVSGDGICTAITAC